MTPEGLAFLKSKKVLASLSIYLIFIILLTLYLINLKRFKWYKAQLIVIFLAIFISPAFFWYYKNSNDYLVSPDEIIALKKLSSMPKGKVIVYDGYCLQCGFSSTIRPAVFSNQRRYVSEISKNPIIYNSSIFKAQTRPDGKKEVEKTGAKYIYVTKYEDYKEILPFSPGDLNIEMIFENANSQIWKVKD